MKRMIPFVVLLVLFQEVTPPAAQEPHIQLIDGLRAKNYHDLALEYLQELSRRTDLPKDVMIALPLEIARTQMEIGMQESDPGRKMAQFAQARKQFEAFLKVNPTSPQAAQAKLDLARIVGSLAKSQYQKARQLPPEGRHGPLLAARAQFVEAGKSLTEAEAGILAQLAKDPKDARLTQARLDLEFEKAVNLLDQMLTYEGDKELAERNKIGSQCQNALNKVILENATNSAGWVARAWLVKYLDETDNFLEAMNKYKDFQAKGLGNYVEPGRRMARAFYVQMMSRKDPNSKELISEGRDWLTDYKTFGNTAEANAIRFVLANAYLKRGEKDPKSKAGGEDLAAAEKLFDELELTENEYTDRARNAKTEILVKRKPELLTGKIEDLQSFRECYIVAQANVGKLNDKKLDDKQKDKHHKNIIDAIHRAFELADETTTTQEKIDARFLLIYYLMVMNQPYKAAVHGEDLARSYPTSSRAGMAGAYALYGYAQIMGEYETNQNVPDNVKETDKARLKSLAEYIESNWKNDVAADAARHQLGGIAMKEKNWAGAVHYLSRISPAYGMYTQTQFYLALSAQNAQREKIPVSQGQKPWNQISGDIFEKMTEPRNLDPEANRYYYYSKIQLTQIQFANRKYDDMERLIQHLQTRLPKLPADLQKELSPMLAPLPVYAKYGKADAEYRSDNKDRYAKVCAIVDPVIDAMINKKLPPDLDPALIRALIGLGLRSNVLDGKLGRAKTILDLLQKTSDNLENQAAILIDLVQQFRRQIDELDKKEAAAKNAKEKQDIKTERDKLVAQLSAFLDELRKQPLDKMKPDIVRFLAMSYSSLGKHEASASMLEAIKEPGNNAKPEDWKFYYTVRIMLGRELRLAKKLEPAGKIFEEVKKTEFGSKSLDLRIEETHLLEDREYYGAAANAWNTLIRDLKAIIAKSGGTDTLKNHYNEAFYRYVWCMYKAALRQKDAKKREDLINRAARLIVQLETGDQMGDHKERYDKLLKEEPALNEKVKDLRKELAPK